MKRLILAIGVLLLLSPIFTFEALYQYELRGLDHTLYPAEASPELLQDALWIAKGESLGSGVSRFWAGSYLRSTRAPGYLAARQLARQFVPDEGSDFERHLQEVALTVWFSRHMTEADLKQRLPEICRFDRGSASGAFVASRMFFHKRMDQLTPGEIATIAALSSSSWSDRERVRRGRDQILTKLHGSGRLTEQQLKDALAERP